MQKMRILWSGLAFGESVRWHSDRAWCADWGAGTIVAVDLDGNGGPVRTVPAMPASFDWLPDGRMLVLAGGLVRVDPDGSTNSHGDLTGLGSRWNELVVDAHGNAYVNQVGFDLMGGEEPRSGTIVLMTPDGPARTVADDVWFPNGMAITQDGTTLIVAESYRNRLSAFTIGHGGVLSDRRVWAELGGGVPDGICMDAEGAVWYADVPNRCCARVAQGGELLQRIELDRGAFSCMLGGPDGRTLLIAATEWNGPQGMAHGGPTGQLLAVQVDVPHAGHP
jgi:sugar lactone lactonase YvrE